MREFALGLTPAEARKIGIKYRSTLKMLKDRVREGEVKYGYEGDEEDINQFIT